MLDARRPPSIPPSDAQGGILTEVILVGGSMAALYFAAYLYEIGFLLRLGLPIAFAEIGFSRSLAIVAVAAPAGCLLAGCALQIRAVAGGRPCLGERGILSALALGSLAACVAALLLDTRREGFLDSTLIAYGDVDLDPLKGALFLGGILPLALYQRHAGEQLARLEGGRTVLSAILLLLMMVLPVGLGWRGAELKEERAGSFLYLAGSDYALVRLYADKAVFLRYDGGERKFGEDYRVLHLDAATEPDLARELEMR